MSEEKLPGELSYPDREFLLRAIELAKDVPGSDVAFLWLPHNVPSADLSRIAIVDRNPQLEPTEPDRGIGSGGGVRPSTLAIWIIGVMVSVRLIYTKLVGIAGLWARSRTSIARFSVRSLTSLAAFLAGRKDGPALRDEWRAHLAGESGHDPVTWAKVWEAVGFVVAGLRDRGQDWADAAWRPVDTVLRSRFLSGLFVAVPTIMVAFEVLTHKGTMTLFTSLGSIFGTWTFLAGAIRTGRKYRDVQPPEPKARETKK